MGESHFTITRTQQNKRRFGILFYTNYIFLNVFALKGKPVNNNLWVELRIVSNINYVWYLLAFQ